MRKGPDEGRSGRKNKVADKDETKEDCREKKNKDETKERIQERQNIGRNARTMEEANEGGRRGKPLTTDGRLMDVAESIQHHSRASSSPSPVRLMMML